MNNKSRPRQKKVMVKKNSEPLNVYSPNDSVMLKIMKFENYNVTKLIQNIKSTQ